VTPRRSASVEASESTRARILVIEPHPLVSESLKELRCEPEVQVLTQAGEALEQIVGGDHFDVILCDLLMPAMTGMDLHAELSRAAPEQAVRMVFLTGATFTDRARVFLERVPNAHFEKALATGELHALIEEMCQRESK
jgi:DNA-binding NarL/FixJ family response regulator